MCKSIYQSYLNFVDFPKPSSFYVSNSKKKNTAVGVPEEKNGRANLAASQFLCLIKEKNSTLPLLPHALP